mmetsp:Transcript_24654/g.34274  ORF Transcript_24654/g.34274 Transcript_24654/m.34274 type:complete len:178 (-) Transcript_24654:164-697(-)
MVRRKLSLPRQCIGVAAAGTAGLVLLLLATIPHVPSCGWGTSGLLSRSIRHKKSRVKSVVNAAFVKEREAQREARRLKRLRNAENSGGLMEVEKVNRYAKRCSPKIKKHMRKLRSQQRKARLCGLANEEMGKNRRRDYNDKALKAKLGVPDDSDESGNACIDSQSSLSVEPSAHVVA